MELHIPANDGPIKWKLPFAGDSLEKIKSKVPTQYYVYTCVLKSYREILYSQKYMDT